MSDQTQAVDVSRVTPAPGTVRDLLGSAAVRARFEQVLGKRAPQFIASLSTLVYGSQQLRRCEPNTIIAAALQAAAFDLPIDPALGYAHLIPYGTQARFQPGWRAFVQLALRTQQYSKLNVTEVYEGELRGENRLTGDLIWGERTGDEIIGYAAYFRLTNGFDKAVFMRVADLDAHGKRYSKTYNRDDSKWKTDFDAMARKTVIKQLLSKWGPLSIEMQQAIAADVPPADEQPTNGNGHSQAPSDEARTRLFGDDETAQPTAQQAPQAPAAADVTPAEPAGEAPEAPPEPDYSDPAHVAQQIALEADQPQPTARSRRR